MKRLNNGDEYLSGISTSQGSRTTSHSITGTYRRWIVTASSCESEPAGSRTHVLEVTINLDRLLKELGKKALESRSRQSREAGGAIIVKVVR